jgi:hypothetical protein
MRCDYPIRGARPAPIWHLAMCGECRKSRKADALMAFALRCRKAETVPAEVLARSLAALDLPYSMPRPNRDRIVRFGRRAQRPTALFLAGLGLAGYGWTRFIEIDPHLAIPTTATPTPNAFDDFQLARGLLKEPKVVDAMLLPVKQIPAPALGATEEARTGKLDSLFGKPTTDELQRPEEHVYTLAEKVDFLRRNVPVLRALRAGLGKSHQIPPVSPEIGHQWNIDFEKARGLSMLLRLDSDAKASRKEWGAAAQSGLDAIEYGSQIQHGSGINGKWQGLDSEIHGRAAVWPIIDKLSASEARDAGVRLQRIIDKSAPLQDSLTEQKWITLAELQEQMREPGWRSRYNESSLAGWGLYVYMLPYSKASILDSTAKYYDHLIAAANGPYIPYNPYASQSEPMPDKIGQILFVESRDYRFQQRIGDTENLLLLTSLALRSFCAENGHYPVSLSALWPTYLRGNYADPFAVRPGPLGYKLTKTGYTLYSAGPDGNDNDGMPIAQIRYGSSNSGPSNMQTNSIGDIVAGQNLN